MRVSNSTTKRYRDYSRANFDAINNELAAFLDEFLLSFSERPVETNWNLFITKINSLITLFISFRCFVSKPQPPYFNVVLKRLSNKKKRFFPRCEASVFVGTLSKMLRVLIRQL